MKNLYLPRGAFPPGFFDGAIQRILDLQRLDGSIPWFDGGVIDPWNHVEAAMGLSTVGCYAEAENAYRWLAENQLQDGSWWAQYGSAVPIGDHYEGDGSDAPVIRDTNFCAYIATGVWHHFLVTGRREFVERLWPTVEAAIHFVLDHQYDEGDVRWAARDAHTPEEDALVTGSASIFKSLESAIRIAGELGHDCTDWEAARRRLGEALRHKPHRFDRTWESKARFSMDWYYPVLSGAIRGELGRAHLAKRWDTFVENGYGCRCVEDEPWVTVAETCELVLALKAIGNDVLAMEMFSWVHQFRHEDGAYWMGHQIAMDVPWPEELPAWTAGAVLIAADALGEVTGAHRLFIDILPDAAPQQGKRFHHR